MILLKSLGKNPSLLLLTSGVVPSNPGWCLHPVSASLFKWPSPSVSIPLRAQIPLFLIRTPVTGFGPTLHQHNLILITSAKALIPKKAHAHVPTVRTPNVSFWKTQLNPQ